MSVIYLRTNKFNRKQYVGQATNLEVRQKAWNCLSQPYAGPAINAARAKYGIEAFDFEILKECEDEELDYWEKYYIEKLNTKSPNGYNLTDGGGGIYGFSHTEESKKKMSEKAKGRKASQETKKKLSEAHKGREAWNKGKHHTEEARKKISQAVKGKVVSEETKKKIGDAHLGMKHTEETRKKIGKIHKGKVVSEETKKKLSEAHKGRECSEETRKKLSETLKGKNKGKHHTEEAREKIAEAMKGEKHWNYGKHWSVEIKIKMSEKLRNGRFSKPVIQIDKHTNKVIAEFPSASEIQRQLGYDNNNISKCCRGKTKSSYGFIWRYKEDAA